jgi:leader peptidase (prepilin peptidase)/N-methyltransferase
MATSGRWLCLPPDWVAAAHRRHTVLGMSAAVVVFVAVFAGMLGASFASYAAATGWRRAVGEPLDGRSHCACGRTLRPAELVPVVSWLATSGEARCCGARLGPALVIGEACGLVVPAAAWLVGAVAFGPIAGALAATVAVAGVSVAVGVHAHATAQSH